MRRVITLLTDFGLLDPYPAVMKAVVLRINPEAIVVDITHCIDSFNVKMGAFILAYAVKYFPKNSIHVAVVDPGVGTARKPLIVECERGWLVGPDNGLLMPAAEGLGLKRVYEVDVGKMRLEHGVSRTFHGRDVFAPAAARLSRGEPLESLGKPYESYVKLALPEPKLVEDVILGEVLYIDGFGNTITNIGENMLRMLNVKTGDLLLLESGSKEFKVRLVNAYEDVKPGTPLAIVNSFGKLELAVSMRDGSKFFKLKPGESLRVKVV